MRELKWTEAEKKLSRRAFEVALQAELAEVLQDFKARAAAAQTPEDMWPVEHFLNHRRRELAAKYDYRYSQLISVFGRLIRERRLTEANSKVCPRTSWSSFGASRTVSVRTMLESRKLLISWRSLRDSNPCYSLERAMSWASRRRELRPGAWGKSAVL